MNSPERSRTAVFGSRAQKDYHYPTGLYNIILFQQELAEEYGIDGLTVCPLMEEGQVFYADYAKPDGFCDEAWKAIYQYVFALAHGADEIWYFGDWIKKTGSRHSFMQ